MDNIEFLEKFVENKNIISSLFKFDNIYSAIAASFIFTTKDVTIDQERLKLCEKIIKEKTGAFSIFRGINKLIVLSKLYFCENEEEYINGIDKTFKDLKKYFKWTQENYLFIAAIVLYENQKENSIEYIQKARSIYDKMKKNHPFLTSSLNVPFAVMLSEMQKSEEKIIEELEEIYNILKNEIFNKTAVYALSAALVLQTRVDVKEKCHKFISLLDALNNADCKYGRNVELATIAPFVNYDENESILAYEIAQLEDRLKSHKGFGSFLFTQAQRTAFVAQMVIINFEKENKINQEYLALNNIINSIIQIQAIILITCCSSATIAASTTY